jgi:hypothetical protein
MNHSNTISILLFFLFASLNIPHAMAIEEAKYEVLEKEGPFELRKYQPHIVAETFVDGNFEDAGDIGFQRLFAFIRGDNIRTQVIEMTSPVSQEKKNEKISMTAPVNMQNIDGLYRITFMMPSEYTFETLPQPLDKKIKLKKEKSKIVAAFKYSGRWSKKRYEKMKDKLISIINSRGLKPAGEPVFARYNSPFMPWFLRRNEILIDIEYHSE